MDFQGKSHIEWANSQPVEKLLDIIYKANDKYYNSSDELFSDKVYDDILDIYNKRSNTKYTGIGSSISESIPDVHQNSDQHLNSTKDNSLSSTKVKLPFHMGSMNKTYSLDIVNKWVHKVESPSFIITPKIDGTSCMVSINIDGSYTIYSRGDGTYGKQINHLGDFILDKTIITRTLIFLTKNNMKKLTVRGELIINKSEFKQHCSGFKSSRSMVNGIVNTIVSKDDIPNSLLELMVFEMIDPQLKPEDQFVLLKKIGFRCVDNRVYPLDKIVDTANLIIPNILEDYKKAYNYDVDGIIITRNIHYKYPESGNPEHSLAFKKNNEGMLTAITDIEWNVSKHGSIIPTIVFETIQLGNNTVNRCSGFNGSFIFNNCLGPGAIIRVVYSGEVIPSIIDITRQAHIPSMPKLDYKWDSNRVHCVLIESNQELEIKRIVNFIKTIGITNMDIGLIKVLFNGGFKTIKDILTISRENLLLLDRIENKMAIKIRNSIDNIIKNPISISKIMDGSLCFGNGFGEKRCRQLVIKYPDFLTNTPSIDVLQMLNGWSDKSINKFINGLDGFKQFLDENAFLNLLYPENSTVHSNSNSNSNSKSNSKSSKIAINKVCVTGARDKDILKFLVDNNVDIVSSVTSNTDLLICENKGSSSNKLKMARSKNISVLSIEEFKKIYKID